jgi:hypothetical protein
MSLSPEPTAQELEQLHLQLVTMRLQLAGRLSDLDDVLADAIKLVIQYRAQLGVNADETAL